MASAPHSSLKRPVPGLARKRAAMKDGEVIRWGDVADVLEWLGHAESVPLPLPETFRASCRILTPVVETIAREQR